jgi:hypothetical protein
MSRYSAARCDEGVWADVVDPYDSQAKLDLDNFKSACNLLNWDRIEQVYIKYDQI